MDLMLSKMESRNARLKAEKKDKKSKKSKPEASSSSSSTVTSATVVKSTEMPSTSGATVKSDESTSKLPSITKHTKLSTTVKREAKDVLADPDIKKLKNCVSVAGDPKATDVYKSLFTSHKSEKEQNRAHWVTYNPFYN